MWGAHKKKYATNSVAMKITIIIIILTKFISLDSVFGISIWLAEVYEPLYILKIENYNFVCCKRQQSIYTYYVYIIHVSNIVYMMMEYKVRQCMEGRSSFSSFLLRPHHTFSLCRMVIALPFFICVFLFIISYSYCHRINLHVSI